VNGYWAWELDCAGARRRYYATLKHNFQKNEGAVRNGNCRGVLSKMTLRDRDSSFSAARQ